MRRAAFLVAAMLLVAGGTAHAADLSNAKRIVAVGGSVTEIVYALGEEKRLAARDSTSVYPPAATTLPDVGYMRALSPEGVLSVDPDAIVMLDGSGPPEAVDVLKKASVPLVAVPETYDRDGILKKIAVIGEALGVKAKADAIAGQVSADINAAEREAKTSGAPARVLFILSMQGGKVLASGTGTAADGMIRMAGGTNVVTEFSGYKQLTDEAVFAAKPDVILMMDRAGDHAAANAEIKAHAALGQTPAAASDRIVRMDGAYLLGFGPRTASAIRDLSKALHESSVTD